MMSADEHNQAADLQSTPSRGALWRRWLLGIGLGSLAILVPIWLRAGVEGRVELSRAAEAEANHDVDRQIEHLGRALRWRAPLWGHDEAALRQLVALGQTALDSGDPGHAVALAAFREARRGLLSTRVWEVPHADTFEAVNHQIAALMAAKEARDGIDTSGRGQPQAHHLELLTEIPGPDPVRGNLAALAMVGWLLSLGGFVMRGLDGHGRLVPRPALRWGAMWLVCLVAWAVLLATAHR